MRDFQKLSIWQKSHLLTIKIYSITKNFPKDEFYGLISQMRRSASSIPTNIAEGCGRTSIPDFKRFLMIAAGSASELHYQLILSHDLHYISETIFKELSEETILIKKMIYGYIGKLTEADS